MKNNTDKKIENFKADYAKIKAQVELIKQKLLELKKEIIPVTKAAYRLFKRGDETMYDVSKGYSAAKFYGLPAIMEDLGVWVDIDVYINTLIRKI